MIIEPDADRNFTRIEFDRQVDLEFVSNSYLQCPIKNLSAGGMFVKGNFSKEEGKCCRILIVQKGVSSDLSLQAIAKVIRKDDEGVALEFTSMPRDSYMLLNLLLLGESDDPLISNKILAESCPFETTDDLPICTS